MKSVKHCLSYLDHKQTNRKTESQSESQTHTSKTMPPHKQSFGRGN